MPKILERTWWFMIPVTVLAGYSAFLLIQAAGIPEMVSFPQMFLFALSFASIRVGYKLAAWLGIVTFAPKLAKSLLNKQ
jgi:hypothetical protein